MSDYFNLDVCYTGVTLVYMPTQKKRINIAVSDRVEDAVSRLARRDEVPVARKALELIEHALEIEEDIAFGRLAESRRNQKGVRYLSHQEVWGTK